MSTTPRADMVTAALRSWPSPQNPAESIEPLVAGVNSTTWLVATQHGRYVAKLVDELDAPGLARGLRIAEFLAARGLRCGPPVRTRAGELTISLPEGALALLRYEPGTTPEGSVADQVRRAGRALARAHEALRDYPVETDPHYQWPWEWVDRFLDTIALPDHVHAAALRVWPEVVRTVEEGRLSISVIHGDPGLGAFLLADDSSGAEGNPEDGIIDWVAAMRGPLLYDLACVVVMSGPEVARWFTEGYVAQQPAIRPELAYLDQLVKARWLANAFYFADRIERGIDRGSTSSTMNHDGLAEAYAGLTAGA